MYYSGYRQNEAKSAIAGIRGGPLAPQLKGTVLFTNVPGGTWVCVQASGLPQYQPGKDGKQPIGPHGFHIHGGASPMETTPAGNAGKRLGCGIIRAISR